MRPEGHDLWLVYDEVANSDADPEPLRRTVLIKYVRTFAW